jgi:hypothetical protein
MSQPTPAQIAALAYQLYVEDGKPEGEAEAHWHRALDILTHPETYSDDNILTPPSEPEITPALDARAQPLDEGLPSDPHSRSQAYHQRIEVGIDGREKKAAVRMQEMLRQVPGIERTQPGSTGETMQIFFDARRTNPAAILEALTASDGDEASAILYGDKQR